MQRDIANEHSMPDGGFSRRFRAVPGRTKYNKKVGQRRSQSLWDLSRSGDDEVSTEDVRIVNEDSGNKPEASKDGGGGIIKKLPKWLRWGGSKKPGLEGPLKKPEKLEFSETRKTSESGFTGNLGIGRYIERDDTAFVNCDNGEETGPDHHRMISKSMVNLESIQLWPEKSSAPIKIQRASRCSQRSSISSDLSEESQPSTNSSNRLENSQKTPGHLDNAKRDIHVPLMIRVLFYTNLPLPDCFNEQDTLTLTNTTEASRKTIDAPKACMTLPAWFITGNEPILTNVTYTLYRTANYREELRRASSWLTEKLLLKKKRKERLAKRRTLSPTPLKFTADFRSRRLNPEASPTATHSLQSGSPGTSQKSPTGESDVDGPSTVDILPKLLPSRTELEVMLQMVNETSRSMEPLRLSSSNSNDELENDSAVILRTEPVSVISAAGRRPLMPDSNCSLFGTVRSTRGSQKKLISEEAVDLYKVPDGLTEEEISPEQDKYRPCSLLLTTDQLLITSIPLPSRIPLANIKFENVLSLAHLWFNHFEPADLTKATGKENDSPPSDKAGNHKKSRRTSSSSISAASFDEDLDKADTKAMQWNFFETSTDELVKSEAQRTLLIGCPPASNWIVRFSTSTVCERWKTMLEKWTSNSRPILEGRSINVKITNELTDNQVVYKYQNVYPSTTIAELKDKAIASMNITMAAAIGTFIQEPTSNSNFTHFQRQMNSQMFAQYNGSGEMIREYPLTGKESPFLIAFMLTYNLCEGSFKSSGESSTPLVRLEEKSTGLGDNSIQWQLKLPETDPVIPRDQVRVDFVLRPKDSPNNKRNKKSRTSKVNSSSFEQKKASPHLTTVRGQKRKGKQDAKTKSTLFLNTASSLALQPVPLRGARSLSSIQTPSSPSQREIFGRLPEDLWPDATLPQSLMSLFVIVYHAGVNVEGIFRRTAVASQIEAMRIKVDENTQPITPSVCSALLAACVLKKFFSEIPGHILVDDNWNDWCRITDIASSIERVKPIERLIKKLPHVNQTLLALLIFLLAHIRDHEESNRMSAEALSAVWGPNVIQRPDCPPTPEDSKMACKIMLCLLHPLLTSSLIYGTPGLHRELVRHYQAIWESFEQGSSEQMTESLTSHPARFKSASHEELFTTDSDVERSAPTSSQERDSTGPSNENLYSASATVPLFEQSSRDDQLSKTSLHSVSSLQSTTTTTSSSADSRNDSPLPTGYHTIMLESKNKSSCIPRRKIFISTDNILPNQTNFALSRNAPQQYGEEVTTPTTANSLTPDAERRLSTGRNSPPPVPPRTHKLMVRMNHVCTVQPSSPPVPPKVKPRRTIVNSSRNMKNDSALSSEKQTNEAEYANKKIPPHRNPDNPSSSGYSQLRGFQGVPKKEAISLNTLARPVPNEWSPVQPRVAVDHTSGSFVPQSHRHEFVTVHPNRRPRRYSSIGYGKSTHLIDLHMERGNNSKLVDTTTQTPETSIHIRKSSVDPSSGFLLPKLISLPTDRLMPKRLSVTESPKRAERRQHVHQTPLQVDRNTEKQTGSDEDLSLVIPSTNVRRHRSVERYRSLDAIPVNQSTADEKAIRFGPRERVYIRRINGGVQDPERRTPVRRISSHASTISGDSVTLVEDPAEQIHTVTSSSTKKAV